MILSLLTLISVSGLVRAQGIQWQKTGWNNKRGYPTAFSSIGPVYFLGMDGYGGLWRSTDGCMNWARMDSALIPGSGDLIRLGNVIAGLEYGRGMSYRSTDSGNTWQSYIYRPPGTPALAGQRIAAKDSSLFYATQFTGIERSRDSGQTWVQVDNGYVAPGDAMQAICVAVCDSVVFAGTPSFGLKRSTNDGDLWTQDSSLSATPIGSFAELGNIIFAYAVDASNSMVVRSDDLGESWQQSSFGLPADFGTNYLASAGMSVAALGYDNSLYLSFDSGSYWFLAMSGIPPNAQILSLAAEGTIYLASTDSGLYKMDVAGVQGVTSGNSVNHDPFLAAYPNPTSRVVRISYNHGLSYPKLNVYNMLGERVLQAAGSSSGESAIDLSKFASGVYYLRISAGDGETRTIKMVRRE